MSLGRIDVEVTDSVAPSIETKLTGIADTADKAQNAIDKLQSKLRQLDAQPFVALAKAYSILNDEINKNNLAYLKQETALNQAIAAEAKAQQATDALASSQAKATANANAAAIANKKLADSHIEVYESIQKEKAAQAAANAQTDFNRLLGVVDSPNKGAARDSASVFGAAFAEQDAAAKSAAAAQNLLAASMAKAEKAAASEAAVLLGLKEAEKAAAAQASINALLNVDKPVSNSAKASAAVFAEALAAEKTAAAAATKELKLADAAMGHFGFTTARSKTELLVLAHELAQGRTKNFAQSLMVLGEQTGIMSKLFTVAGATSAVLVAALAAVAYVAASGITAMRAYNNSLLLTNSSAGLTADGFIAMSDSVAAATNVSKSSAQELVLGLAKTGVFQRAQIKEFAISAQLLSKLTGQSTDDIIKDFEKAADAPTKYATTLTRQLNFLSLAQLEHIRRLEEMGDKEGATAALSKDLFDYLGNQAPAKLSVLGGALHSTAVFFSDAYESAKRFFQASFNPTIGQQIASIQSQIANAQLSIEKGYVASLNNPVAKAAAQAKLKELNDQLQSLKEVQSVEEKVSASKSAEAELQRLGIAALGDSGEFLKFTNNVEGAANKIAKFQKTVHDLLAANPTDQVGLKLQANSAAIIAGIKKEFESKQNRIDDNADLRRASDLAKYIAELHSESDALGLVGDARERVLKLDKLDEQLKALNKGKGKGLSTAERERVGSEIDLEQQNKRINEAGNALDQYVNGPERAFHVAQVAAAEQLAHRTVSQDDATASVNRAKLAMDRSKDSLYDTNKAIDDQSQLLGKYGDAQQLAAQMQAAQNAQLEKGRTLYDAESGALNKDGRALENRYKELSKNQQVDKLVGQIWQDNIGASQDLTKQIEAQNIALQKGFESADQYAIAMNKIAMAQAQLKVNNGTASFADAATASLAKFQTSYKGVAAGATEAFGNFFDQFASGAADAFGKAITGQESFKKAIEETAQSALSALISALVKVGIQYLINAAMGESAAATTAATSAGLAETTALAWAPAAALVNAATFGAAADAADVALPVTLGVAEAIALGGFMGGGYTGNMPTNAVAGVVHGQEFVANASATARNRPVLEAMNRGETFGAARGANAPGDKAGRSKVDVHNYTGTSVRVEQDDDNTRILVGQELQRQLPSAMGSEVTKPNSPFNKNMRKFTTIRRRTA